MAEFEYDREQLSDKLLSLVGSMTDAQLDELVSKIEDPPELAEVPAVATAEALYSITLDTAELDETYFQGFLNGADIRHKIVAEVGNALTVEYVGTMDAITRMAKGSFSYSDPSKADELNAKIQPVKG
jgi:hypothetical protein